MLGWAASRAKRQRVGCGGISKLHRERRQEERRQAQAGVAAAVQQWMAAWTQTLRISILRRHRTMVRVITLGVLTRLLRTTMIGLRLMTDLAHTRARVRHHLVPVPAALEQEQEERRQAQVLAARRRRRQAQAGVAAADLGLMLPLPLLLLLLTQLLEGLAVRPVLAMGWAPLRPLACRATQLRSTILTLRPTALSPARLWTR